MHYISRLKIQRRILILVGALFAVIGLSAAGVAIAATKSAGGATCTIVGTEKNDVIKGTVGNDIICGLGGNDTIIGLGGDDVIDGGAGNDTLIGGAGNDTLIGGAGNDTFDGGIGLNTASFQDSSAAVSASLATGKASGDGKDTLANIINLTGGGANDILTGNGAANLLNGGGGNDTIAGGAGNDILQGGAGNDILQGGFGDDAITGGDGRDTLNYSDNSSGVSINLATGVETGQGSDTISGDENVIAGSGNDTITGDAADNSINAGSGNDTIAGGAGNDSLTGGAGNDVISGGAGNDAIIGSAGSDTLDYSINTTGMIVNLATGASTGDGSDTISGDENVIAGSGNDTITGNSDANNIDAGPGNDTITGGAGNDTLAGGAGNDRLVGDAGNDALQGGPGNDGLVGGDGSDTLAGSVGEPAVTEKNLCENDSHDTVSYCGFDENAPWVESATLSRTEVDSSGSAQTVTATMHVTDELMGVEYAGCSITLENARQPTGYERAVRISGDAIDGIYTCNVNIPKGGSTGRWGLNFDTRDGAGNLGLADQGPNGKWHSNLPEIMSQTPEHWINQVGVGDMLAPRITNPSFSVSTIDTSSAVQTFTVDMTVSDDYSGVSAVLCDARHGASIDPKPGYASDVSPVLISGDKMSGVWRCTIKLPLGAGHGKWGIMISASDLSAKGYSIETDFNNDHKWIVGDLTLPYLPEPITSDAQNYITQTGVGDDLAPVLQSISFDRTTINSSSSDQTVTATLTVAPEQWGLPRVIIFDVLSPQTMAEHQAPCIRTMVNDDGSTVWSCTFTIQLGSAKGLFAAMIWLADDAGNRADFRGDPATGKWKNIIDATGQYNWWDGFNLDLGPVGVTNTDK